MKHVLFKPFEPYPDDDPIETYRITITIDVNARYGDAKAVTAEIVESLEWLTPEGGHRAIMAGEWEATDGPE